MDVCANKRDFCNVDNLPYSWDDTFSVRGCLNTSSSDMCCNIVYMFSIGGIGAAVEIRNGRIYSYVY